MMFRPRRSGSVLAVAVCFPVLTFGLAALPFELEIGLLFTLVGAVGVYCGVGYLCMRTMVDEVGLRRSPIWFDRFRVRWADVVSWSVEPFDPIDSPDGCQILWVVRRRFWSIRIADYEVSRPGFEVLVEQVKTRFVERERARGAQSRPRDEEANP